MLPRTSASGVTRTAVDARPQGVGWRCRISTVSADCGRLPFAIGRIEALEDARFGGVLVLGTNAKLSPLLVMLRYKHLWPTERVARDLLATRPIFHEVGETIRGHLVCSVLALLLRQTSRRALPSSTTPHHGPAFTPISTR